jgi:Na+-transporting NADH:ubiquinone oxidoreductase subunit C
VSIVGVLLTAAYSFFKPYHLKNIKQEKMSDLLYVIGLDKASLQEVARTKGLALSYELIEEYFEKHFVKQLVINEQGEEVRTDIKAFDINLKAEMKKPSDKQVYPLYIAEKDGKIFYVIPLYGKGLWDDIWGYVALDEDLRTIVGIKFDHKAETPGLGAEITSKWFEDRFVGETLFDEQGNFVGIDLVKNLENTADKTDHKVDAISGSTLTSNGVEEMINERVKHYEAYFKKLKNK